MDTPRACDLTNEPSSTPSPVKSTRTVRKLSQTCRYLYAVSAPFLYNHVRSMDFLEHMLTYELDVATFVRFFDGPRIDGVPKMLRLFSIAPNLQSLSLQLQFSPANEIAEAICRLSSLTHLSIMFQDFPREPTAKISMKYVNASSLLSMEFFATRPSIGYYASPFVALVRSPLVKRLSVDDNTAHDVLPYALAHGVGSNLLRISISDTPFSPSKTIKFLKRGTRLRLVS
jgi:hypothetical protein